MERVRDAGRVSHPAESGSEMVFGARALELARPKNACPVFASLTTARSLVARWWMRWRSVHAFHPSLRLRPLSTHSIWLPDQYASKLLFSPSVAYDPNNPNDLVEAAVSDATCARRSAEEFSLPVPRSNQWRGRRGVILPTSATSPAGCQQRGGFDCQHPCSRAKVYVDATDPTVAFDLNDNVFICFSEHTTDNSSGCDCGERIQPFAGGTFNTTPEQNQNPVYKWNAGADSAWTPTMAVDDNPATFTDPNTAITLTDPNSGNIYVAWASQDIAFTGAVNFNPDRAMMVVANDNAADTTQQLAFSAPMEQSVYNNGGNEVNSNTGGEVATPRIVVSAGSQSDPGDVAPGQVSIIWDNISTGRNASPKYDPIEDTSTDSGSTYPVNPTTNVPENINASAHKSSAITTLYRRRRPGRSTPIPPTTGALPSPIQRQSPSARDRSPLRREISTPIPISTRRCFEWRWEHYRILRGNGNDTFVVTTGVPAGTFSGPVTIGTADFDKDGKIDLIVVDASGVWILTGNGNDTFNVPVRVFTKSGLTGLAIGDINGDGLTDFAVTDFATNQVFTGFNTTPTGGPISFAAATGWNADGLAPEGVAIGDVNGDNVEDLVVADYGSNSISVLLGVSNGRDPGGYFLSHRPLIYSYIQIEERHYRCDWPQANPHPGCQR